MEWKRGYAMQDCQPRFPKIILTFDKTQALDHLRQDGPWCNGGRESRRSSVPPKQELRTNLLNLFYRSCLPGAQEREEEQGLGSEGEEAATECLDSLVCLNSTVAPLCAVWPSLGQPAPGI